MPEIQLNEKRYTFADCPKCGHRRPLQLPGSGLCWSCGRHYHDAALADVHPELRDAFHAIDRRISEALSGDYARLSLYRHTTNHNH